MAFECRLLGVVRLSIIGRFVFLESAIFRRFVWDFSEIWICGLYNSVDKQTGSLALIRQLVGAGATGIIATHDLALGKLADSLPGKVGNYRFEAAIQGDELTFSYRLQPGIAENMNACFLMRKMGIIPSDSSEND